MARATALRQETGKRLVFKAAQQGVNMLTRDTQITRDALDVPARIEELDDFQTCLIRILIGVETAHWKRQPALHRDGCRSNDLGDGFVVNRATQTRIDNGCNLA